MITDSPKEQKDALRKEYKEKRRTISTEEKQYRDAEICKRAAALASFRHAEYVLLYDAMPREICLTPLALTALENGKKIAYPRCDTESCTMTYRLVSSPEELFPDSYGIREPLPDAPLLDTEIKTIGEKSVCFVPGLIFDKSGYRLGYGKGYYDRFLKCFKGSKIGVVYSDFILPSVPRGRYDEKTDILLTEKGVIYTNTK